MKKVLLFSMLLLFVGVNMRAQSIATEQMDERFNDGTKLPYGWFAEGWEVKDGVAQKKASSGFDMTTMMGSGGSSGFDYLMTPPLQVQDGEKLVFSARKAKASGMGAMMGGSSDSTFVVEQAFYGQHQWKKVADFTTEMDSIYKTFSVSVAKAGEYRFRFRAAGEVNIDSVAGFHIDNAAPDILVIRDTTKAVSYLDLGLCKADTTTVFNVINTATGTLKTSVESTNESIFTVSTKEVTAAPGDSIPVNATFKVSGGKSGRNDAFINFTPTDERVSGRSINMVAVISDPEAWAEDFTGNRMPKGWFTEGWGFRESVATVNTPSDGMGGMFGGSAGSFYLMTPVLTVNDPYEALLFSVKNAGGGGMGAMMGGSGPSLTIEKSVYGSNQWEKLTTITESLDSVFKTLWVSNIEPGDYRFRFVTTDSIVIDQVSGFRLNSKAPDLYVTLDSMTVRSFNYGMPQANSSKTFIVMNTASDELQVNVTSTNAKVFTLSESSLTIAAGDSVLVNVVYDDAAGQIGDNQGYITFTPTDQRLMAQTVSVEAYKTYPDAWSEDFEPLYVVEDESIPLNLPEWKTTGWEISKPSDGGGMMAMFGMGGGAQKTWMATTKSDAYELVTPSLQAKKGDVLRFQAEMGGGGMMDMMSMFGMGGGSGLLNVFYSKDGGKTWTYYNTYTQTGIIYFKAPYTGIYNIKFMGLSVSLDNFLGFKRPIEEISLLDAEDNSGVLSNYNGKNVNVAYDRTLSAQAEGDGSWTPKAYTISLPYELNFTDYGETDNMKLYELSYIDNYYKQFIFSEVPAIAEAGKAYLAVIDRGSVALNAIDVKIANTPADEASVVVNDYEKWYQSGGLDALGTWRGTFKSINGTAEDNIYGLADDGSWILLANGTLSAFRAYFQANTAMAAETYGDRISASKTRSFSTMFHATKDEDAQEFAVVERPGLLFTLDIQSNNDGNNDGTTGISPTIHTIDNDGTHRYYDLNGRQLKSKPQKGIYIENGIKHVK